MNPEPNIFRINFTSLDRFPVFIDYDMDGMKCRGMSAKIDLFSYGALTAEIDKFSKKDLEFARDEGIFIRKSGLLFESGFFLFDFKYLQKSPEKFIEKVRNMNLEVVYLENSKHFQMDSVVADLDFCRAHLMEFDDASHG
ncbi:hypothetical protein Dacet_1328 [Denitrovibrio acetiphilus DSM 12809]|uniref:Uncharacterized protein n=1 Tax=Denitrovibrio acetiphilus (strain DSM 12809 / NBRC 114555 / N2460) TaxID=522772 RepID=D4H7V1_DENA2|nr:hypothetical protein [Denitrovibrio acetiphilus]ADD68100.1 hypothetical protein Dacet_1328 [Denitrovibrio acetiphilus DSM 12809]